MKECEKREGEVQREDRTGEKLTQEEHDILTDVFILRLLDELLKEQEGDIHLLTSNPEEGIIFEVEQ